MSAYSVDSKYKESDTQYVYKRFIISSPAIPKFRPGNSPQYHQVAHTVMTEPKPHSDIVLLPNRSWFDRLCFAQRQADPKSHSAWQKNSIVIIITLSAFTAPFASCILFPSFTTLVDHFHTTEPQVALTTTVFLIGLAIAPLWWSSLSQEYGRRPVLVVSFLFSAIAVIDRKSVV